MQTHLITILTFLPLSSGCTSCQQPSTFKAFHGNNSYLNLHLALSFHLLHPKFCREPPSFEKSYIKWLLVLAGLERKVPWIHSLKLHTPRVKSLHSSLRRCLFAFNIQFRHQEIRSEVLQYFIRRKRV